MFELSQKLEVWTKNGLVLLGTALKGHSSLKLTLTFPTFFRQVNPDVDTRPLDFFLKNTC